MIIILLSWQPNNGTLNNLTKMTFLNKIFPNNKQIYELGIWCIIIIFIYLFIYFIIIFFFFLQNR